MTITDIASPTRRERLRLEALEQITAAGLEQLAAGGPAALSLNAIARSIGMTGPAIYRYFAGRDELLAALTVRLFEDLARTLDEALAPARRRAPATRLRLFAETYRSWALAHGCEYAMLFDARGSSRPADTPGIIAASHRSMQLLIACFSALPSAEPPARTSSALRETLRAWAAARGDAPDAVPAEVLRLSTAAWSRLHGVISLELAGVYDATGVDAQAFFASEVDALIREATGA